MSLLVATIRCVIFSFFQNVGRSGLELLNSPLSLVAAVLSAVQAQVSASAGLSNLWGFLPDFRTHQPLLGFQEGFALHVDNMREIQDLMDLFPYCLLVALPVFIALSPMPVHAVAVAAASSAHDFPVHRYAGLSN